MIRLRRHKPPSRLWRALAVGPFEVPLALYLGVVGVLALISGSGLKPATIEEALPYWLVMIWTFCIGFGGLATAAGKIVEHGRLESVGLVLLGYGSTFYAVTLLLVALPVSAVSAAAFLAIAAGSGLRLRVLAQARQATTVADMIVVDSEEH